jgi:BirA family biotin operon repressor/biotin-[acetyl-CoA-carboxylase] ligase
MNSYPTIAGPALPPLHTHVVGSSLYFYDTVESTNALALRRGRRVVREDGAVFVAERQTAGRGRHGNAWHSAAGLGLWFSVSLKGPSQGLMFAAALAVRDAARPKARLSIKWPNDVLCAGRKLCGVLVEHRDGWSAVGIGINVKHRPEDFPEELRESAGSLESATDREWDRDWLLSAVLQSLDGMVLRLRRGEQEAIWREWVAACRIIGATVRRDDVVGRVTAIDERGALLVETDTGLRRITSGDPDMP